MLTDYKNSFTAALSKKFAAKLLLYFSPHLKRNIKDQKWQKSDIFDTITAVFF